MTAKPRLLLPIIFCSLLIMVISVNGQDDRQPVVITADNIENLRPTVQLNYADSVSTEMFNTGSFAIDDRGQTIAVIGLLDDGRKRLTVWAGDAQLSMNDGQSWDTDEDIASVLLSQDAEQLWVATQSEGYTNLYGASLLMDDLLTPELTISWQTSGTLLEMWEGNWDAGSSVMGRSLSMEFAESVGSSIAQWRPDNSIMQIPYIPDTDETAVVRVGRIPLPYVVTSSLEGIVTLWDVDTSKILYQVDNGLGIPSVFGNINASASHFVWRDNVNQTLYLLEFSSGENQQIASLNGDYAQWYFLTPEADVILAVNLGFKPNVFAWLVETGERINLGAYRACSRPQPDMARLSADGTTLVIGCDTGLELWRIGD